MTESEFQKRLEWLIDETRAALAVYDTYEELNRLAVDRNDIQAAMLADHAFWQVQLGALQDCLFIILGRLFDKHPGAHSISKVLDAAKKYIGFFSHEELSRRKREGGLKAPWLISTCERHGYRSARPSPHSGNPWRNIRNTTARYICQSETTMSPTTH